MRRTKGYDKTVSDTLVKSRAARQRFLLSLVEDHGVTPEDALKEAILTMGQKEFSKIVDMSAGRIGDYIQGRRKLKFETIDTLLKSFGVRAEIKLKRI